MAVILDGNFIETKELFILKITYLQEASEMGQTGAVEGSLSLFRWLNLREPSYKTKTRKLAQVGSVRV